MRLVWWVCNSCRGLAVSCLQLCRSIGTGPWLLPHGDLDRPQPLPAVLIRSASTVTVRVCSAQLRLRRSSGEEDEGGGVPGPSLGRGAPLLRVVVQYTKLVRGKRISSSCSTDIQPAVAVALQSTARAASGGGQQQQQQHFFQQSFQVTICPFGAVCLPLNHSGHPGVNDVSYRGGLRESSSSPPSRRRRRTWLTA